jgi:hypothetical protein
VKDAGEKKDEESTDGKWYKDDNFNRKSCEEFNEWVCVWCSER